MLIDFDFTIKTGGVFPKGKGTGNSSANYQPGIVINQRPDITVQAGSKGTGSNLFNTTGPQLRGVIEYRKVSGDHGTGFIVAGFEVNRDRTGLPIQHSLVKHLTVPPFLQH
jgi:hypothetical protein